MDVSAIDPWFTREFVAFPGNPGFDYESRDGQIGLEFKMASATIRDLHAGVFQIAKYLSLRNRIQLGCLVIARDRLSESRVADEWEQIRSVLKSDVASRLAIIAVGRDGLHVDPPDPRLLRLGQVLYQTFGIPGDQVSPLKMQVRRTGKLDEVTKVLLGRWLRRQGPLRTGELAELVGCSAVTALAAVRLLSARRALNRVPNRPVELSGFPNDLWSELTARERNQPSGWRFVDASGQPNRVERLLTRISNRGVPGLAVGGVVAARHWCPDLDLNGTPRLDFVLHSPDGTADLDFIQRADPALKLVTSNNDAVLVVVHPLQRAVPLFESTPGGLPVADPVETVLHLEGLRLPVQAKQVLAHLRPELRYI